MSAPSVTGGAQQHEREEVGGDHHEPSGGVHRLELRTEVSQLTRRGRRREQRAEAAWRVEIVDLPDDELDADRLGARAQHGDRLRMGVGVDEERVAGVAALAAGHRHRLCRSGRLVEHRGVGDVHAGEVGDHRLEVEERLQPALADLGLVGGVRGVPGGVLEHVAQDHGGSDRAVVAEPDQVRHAAVATGDASAARRARRSRCGGPAARAARVRGSTRARPGRCSSATDPSPRVASILSRSLASGPMWRRGNSPLSSRASRSGRTGTSGGDGSGLSVPPLSWAPESFTAPCRAAFPFGEARQRGGPAFQRCLTRAVRSPERFRGGCSFGARSRWLRAGLSRVGSSAPSG